MSLTLGTTQYRTDTPGAGASFTFNHNQTAGSDKCILLVMTMANSSDFSTCTYGGVAMTNHFIQSSGGLAQRWAAYSLVDPASGNNNIVANFTGAQYNPVSFVVLSWTNCGGIGNTGKNNEVTGPHSQNLTVSENSMIYATGCSQNAQSFGYEIDGSTRTNLFYHNTNKVVEGALSATNLTAGSINVTTTVDFSTISNTRIEIKEAVAAPSGNSGNFLEMF